MMDERNGICFNHVSFAYPGKIGSIIDDITLTIPLKKSTALLGLNGTGKTTLLMLLLGYLKPNKGNLFLDDDRKNVNLSAINSSVGYLSQRENIPFDYTVNEFVLLGRAPHVLMFGTPSKKDDQITNRVIEALDLAHLKRNKLGEISGGELQRARIARTLAQEPEIILMDEPMTHLDIKNKNYLNNLIINLIDIGKTVIYSTHDPLDVLNFSDYCIILGKNNHYIDGVTEELITSSVLTKYFEIPITVVQNNGNKSIFVNQHHDSRQ